jgi:hypothetical protein
MSLVGDDSGMLFADGILFPAPHGKFARSPRGKEGDGAVIRGHPRPDERVQLSLLCIMMGSRCPLEMILGCCLLMGYCSRSPVGSSRGPPWEGKVMEW